MKNIVSSIENAEVSDVIYKMEDENVDNPNVVVKSAVAVLKNAKTGNITGESVCVYWQWAENRPILKDEDYIRIRWNDKAFCYDSDYSFHAEDYYRKNETDKWTAYKEYTSFASTDQDSIGNWTSLAKFKNYVGGAMVFNLVVTAPRKSNVGNEGYLAVDYLHEAQWLKTVLYFAIPILIIILFILAIDLRKKRKAQ